MFWRFLPVPRRQDRWLQPKSALWCRTGPTHRVLTRSQVCPPSSSCVNLPVFTAPPLPHSISSHSSSFCPVRQSASPPPAVSTRTCVTLRSRGRFDFCSFGEFWETAHWSKKKKAKKGDKILFLKYFYDKKTWLKRLYTRAAQKLETDSTGLKFHSTLEKSKVL